MALKLNPEVASLHSDSDSDSDSGKSDFDEQYYANRPPIIPIDRTRVRPLKRIANLSTFPDSFHQQNDLKKPKQLKQHSSTTIISDALVTGQGQGNGDNNRQVYGVGAQNYYNNKENYLDPENRSNQFEPITTNDQLVEVTSNNGGQSTATVAVIEVDDFKENRNTPARSTNYPICSEENSPQSRDIDSDNFNSPTTWYECLADCLCWSFGSV